MYNTQDLIKKSPTYHRLCQNLNGAVPVSSVRVYGIREIEYNTSFEGEGVVIELSAVWSFTRQRFFYTITQPSDYLFSSPEAVMVNEKQYLQVLRELEVHPGYGKHDRKSQITNENYQMITQNYGKSN
jgi:hypothetical protein